MSTSFKTNGATSISLPSLSNGVYVVQLKTNVGKINRKIVLD